jgi:cytochrome P450
MADQRPNRASLADTLRVVGGVFAPMLAQGVVRRRPRVVALAERLDADRRANDILHRLHDRYGDRPLLLRVPGRKLAIPFDPDDVREVLAASPDPFALATTEKRAVLRHFQPDGVLVTRGPLRAPRRALNEAVLETHDTIHRLGTSIANAAAEEADTLRPVDGPRTVDYAEYAAAFRRTVRRVTLGDSARDDEEVTAVLDELRAAANWAYLRPPRAKLRGRLDELLKAYVQRGEAGSLAAEVRLQYALPGAAEVDPKGQMPQWLFAFDAVAIASARLLAVLATHPEHAALARTELHHRDLSEPQYLPYLRDALHESTRLWPTTLVVLRQTTAPATAGGTSLPAGTQLVIVSGYFHRDPVTVPHADHFTPGAWIDGRDAGAPKAAAIPFSDGPGRCPGENLALLVATTFAGRLLQKADVALEGDAAGRLDPAHPLPGTLNPYGLRFRLTPRG